MTLADGLAATTRISHEQNLSRRLQGIHSLGAKPSRLQAEALARSRENRRKSFWCSAGVASCFGRSKASSPRARGDFRDCILNGLTSSSGSPAQSFASTEFVVTTPMIFFRSFGSSSSPRRIRCLRAVMSYGSGRLPRTPASTFTVASAQWFATSLMMTWQRTLPRVSWTHSRRFPRKRSRRCSPRFWLHRVKTFGRSRAGWGVQGKKLKAGSPAQCPACETPFLRSIPL